MRKVGKATAVALLTPVTAAAIAALTSPAQAAGPCPFLSAPTAVITPPPGTITAGSTVHVSATICGMLLGAHLQIQGPGIDQQVDRTVNNDLVKGDVKIPDPGHFTLSVIGNATKHTYATQGFSVEPRPLAAAPAHTAPGRSPSPTGGGAGAGAGNPFKLPSGASGGAGGTGGLGNLRPLNQSSPFSLPSVAPDGAGVQYPTPDPEVAAAPTARPQARNVAATTPISWGQSIAVALVLLLLSAHFGMWSRRQRLAAEGARGGSPSGDGRMGAGKKRPAGRKARQNRTARPSGGAGAADLVVAVPVDEHGGTQVIAPAEHGEPRQADVPATASIDDPAWTNEWQSSPGHGYRGRRRRP